MILEPHYGIQKIKMDFNHFLAHLSRRLTRRAYSIPVDPASVRASVRP